MDIRSDRQKGLSYVDGLQGKSGYPLNLDEERREFAEASGKDLEGIRSNPLILPLVTWCNDAYAQGQKEANHEDQA